MPRPLVAKRFTYCSTSIGPLQYLKRPNGVMNVVRSWSSSLSGICQCPQWDWTVVKNFVFGFTFLMAAKGAPQCFALERDLDYIPVHMIFIYQCTAIFSHNKNLQMNKFPSTFYEH